MSRHARPRGSGHPDSFRVIFAGVRAGSPPPLPPPVPAWVMVRWVALTLALFGAALIVAFPASHIGTLLAVIAATVLLEEVFR